MGIGLGRRRQEIPQRGRSLCRRTVSQVAEREPVARFRDISGICVHSHNPGKLPAGSDAVPDLL